MKRTLGSNDGADDTIRNEDLDSVDAEPDSLVDRLRTRHENTGSDFYADLHPSVVDATAAYMTEVEFGMSQPAQTGTSVTGGGSVTFDQYGCHVNPGATSGDQAGIGYSAEAGSVAARRDFIEVSFFLDSATPISDSAEVGTGAYTGSVGETGGGDHLYEPHNERFLSAGNAKPAPSVDRGGHHYAIIVDREAGETRHYFEGVLEATYNTAWNLGDNAVGIQMESNGTGNEIRLYNARAGYIL